MKTRESILLLILILVLIVKCNSINITINNNNNNNNNNETINHIDYNKTIIHVDPSNPVRATITPIDSASNYNSNYNSCLLYTSPSPRDRTRSRMPSSA